MTVERSWCYEGPFTLGEGNIIDFDDTGAEISRWIPDTRLQTIADAYIYFIEVSERRTADTPEAREAFTKLLRTLDNVMSDALTEENNDE